MDLDELYQQTILDHSKKPRNFGKIEDTPHYAHGDNPSCGDEIELFLKINDEGIIEDVKFDGAGCAISQASASMMTLKIKGKPLQEVQQLLEEFHSMVTENKDPENPKALGELRLLQGVQKFPQRVKCATLAWQALRQILENLKNKKTD